MAEVVRRPFHGHPALADLVLNFDPAAPQLRYQTMLEGEPLSPEAALPKAVPWPDDAVPKGAPLATAPAETDDLSRFAGYDAVVVTWTAAEAAALATLFSPDHPVSSWYEYRHGRGLPAAGDGEPGAVQQHRGGHGALPSQPGAVFPVHHRNQAGAAVQVRPASRYDGSAVPVRRLMTEIAQAVSPVLFVTTGTGGGVKLGDVVAGGTVRFDCHAQFEAEPWATASSAATPLSAPALAAVTQTLTAVNAARIPDAGGAADLCRRGRRACRFPHIVFRAIRNASDPQIANPTGNIETAGKQAASIYARYGGLTTAASVIASRAAVRSA